MYLYGGWSNTVCKINNATFKSITQRLCNVHKVRAIVYNWNLGSGHFIAEHCHVSSMVQDYTWEESASLWPIQKLFTCYHTAISYLGQKLMISVFHLMHVFKQMSPVHSKWCTSQQLNINLHWSVKQSLFPLCRNCNVLSYNPQCIPVIFLDLIVNYLNTIAMLFQTRYWVKISRFKVHTHSLYDSISMLSVLVIKT